MPLIRYDEKAKVRLDLDQPALKKAATDLLEELETHLEDYPAEAAKYKSLQAYAEQGLAGQIQKPRTWNDDPLREEFRAGELPEDLEDAYGTFTFYTHGLTIDIPKVIQKDGIAYIELES